MKKRFFAIFALCVLVLNLGGSTFAQTGAKKVKSDPLVSMLPAVDAVASIDVKRFFADALPKLLMANQPILTEVVSKMDELKARTGIDIRQFDKIAVGAVARSTAPGKFAFDPVFIARGDINAAAMIAAGKLAANGKYREEKFGDRTVYIFNVKEIAEQHKAKIAQPDKTKMVDDAVSKLAAEMAVTAYDANTLVIGDVPLVRQTLEGKTKVAADISGLLVRNETSIFSFAAKTPVGLKELLPMENDELGKNIDAIKYLYGGMNMVADGASFSLNAKTIEAAQAKDLSDTLLGLQMIGKAFLGSSDREDTKIYGRLIDNAKIASKGNEVSFDLRIAQNDINTLVDGIKMTASK